MKPGQRVRATLILDKADALVVPRQAVIGKDGKNVVYKRGDARLRAGRGRARRGTSGRVVDHEGPRAGDVIALRDPTRSIDQAIGSGSGSAGDVAEARRQAMRRILDAFVVALESLAEHKLRTTLTMLGMMFGVGAVIAMLSIGAGAEKQALALIDRLGTRNVVVRSKTFKPDELEEIRKKSLGLSQRDVEAIEEAVPGVSFAAPRIEIEPYKILAAGAKTKAQVFGVGHRHREVTPFALAEGRFLDVRDEKHHAQVCVIGAGVRRDLFGADPALGRDVKINDVWCEVIGVLAPEPGAGHRGPGRGGLVDGARDLPAVHDRAAQARSRSAEVAARRDRRAPRTARRPPPRPARSIGTLLDRLHGGARDYEIIVPEALLRHSQQTQQLFNLVMGLIAGISLLVGGIGIMNIMLASVLEQTREIGVRRAVGARRADIRFQFLVTAFTLAMLGGLAGVAMGLGDRARRRELRDVADGRHDVVDRAVARRVGRRRRRLGPLPGDARGAPRPDPGAPRRVDALSFCPRPRQPRQWLRPPECGRFIILLIRPARPTD